MGVNLFVRDKIILPEFDKSPPDYGNSPPDYGKNTQDYGKKIKSTKTKTGTSTPDVQSGSSFCDMCLSAICWFVVILFVIVMIV